jgi:hypothetical protein
MSAIDAPGRRNADPVVTRAGCVLGVGGGNIAANAQYLLWTGRAAA